jgi:hypothetical protein
VDPERIETYDPRENTMKNALGLVVILAMLSSCAVHKRDGDPGMARANPKRPQVDVLHDKVIVVDQEPIFIPRNFTDKSITWELVNRHYSFVEIKVEPNSAGQVAFSNCRDSEQGRKLKCDNNGTPGKYKYTIKVRGPAEIEPLDPWIRND